MGVHICMYSIPEGAFAFTENEFYGVRQKLPTSEWDHLRQGHDREMADEFVQHPGLIFSAIGPDGDWYYRPAEDLKDHLIEKFGGDQRVKLFCSLFDDPSVWTYFSY